MTNRIRPRTGYGPGERGSSKILIAEARLVGDGKEKINLKTIFWPDRARIKVRSLGDSLYWKKCLGKMCACMTSKAKDTLEVAPLVPI